MAHYTFDIIKYTLITEEGETYKDFIEMMPSLTVQATNYIAATLKAEKAYPSDKYVHQLSCPSGFDHIRCDLLSN